MSEKLHNIINVCVGRLLFIFLGIVIYLQNLFGIITQTQWNVYAASSSSQLSQSCLYSSGVRHQDINYSACGYKDPVNFIQDHKIDKSKFSHQGKDGGFVGKKIAIVAEMSGKMGMKNVIINGEGVARSLALYAKDRGVIEGDNVNISDVIDAIYASEGTTVALKGSTLKAKARIVHAGKGARVSLDGFGQMRGVKGIVIEGAKVQVSNSSFLGTEFGINVDHKDQERGDLRLTKVNIGRESTEEEKKTGNIIVDKPKVGIQVKNNSVAEVKEGKIIANATGLEVDNGGDVRLSDTNIIAKQGMRVRSNKSKVTMDSGSITSLNDDTILILGASVSLFGVKLENIAKRQVIHIRDGGTLYMEGGSIVAEEGRAVQVGKGNMTLHNVNINSKDSAGIWAEQGKVSITEGVIDASKVAVKVDQKGDERTSILLNKVTVKSKGMGGEQALYAIKGTIEMIEGQIKAQGVAVQASNGTIKLSDGVAVNSGGSHGLVVEGKEATIEMTKGSITAKETAVKASNGTIKLSDGVAVNSEGSYGLMVEGKEATIEMTKGSITAKETAVKASNGTIKLSDGVAVNSGGSHGLVVEGKEATIEMTKGSITAKETAVKASNGTIKLSDGVAVNSEGSYGLIVEGKGATIEMVGGSIIVNSVTLNKVRSRRSTEAQREGVAVKALGDGYISLSGGVKVASTESEGLVAEGERATIEMAKGSVTAKKVAVKASSKGSIELSGDVEVKSTESEGLVAEGERATIEMAKGSVTAKKVAVKASNKGSIELSNDVKVASTESEGLVAEGERATIEMAKGSVTAKKVAVKASNEGSIKLSGGVEVASTEAEGLVAEGNNASIEMEKGSIIAREIAVKASNKGSIELSNDVKVASTEAEGLVAEGNNASIKMDKGSIIAREIAVKALNEGSIKLSDDVKVESIKSIGLWAEDNNASIEMTKGSITAKYMAVVAFDRGNIKLNGVEVKSTESEGLVAEGNNASIKMDKGSIIAREIAVKALNEGSIKLSDDVKVESIKSIGLWAEDNNASIEMTKGSITAKYMAVVAFDRGNIKLNGVEVKSTESEGLVAEGEGATIKMDKGSVTAEGIAVKASHKGNIKLDDVEVKSAAKVGLWAHDEGTTIEMTNGSIQAQTEGGDGIKWSGYHFK